MGKSGCNNFGVTSLSAPMCVMLRRPTGYLCSYRCWSTCIVPI